MTTIAVRTHKHPFRPASAQETLERNLIGNNVGNLVFSQATFRLLWRDDQEVVPLPASATAVDDEADVIVLPLANAFRRTFIPQLDRLTALVDASDKPVVVLGVGAQARLEGEVTDDPDVDAAATRFVRAVLEHGPSVGVRGEHTRDYLRGLGFGDDSIDVIGCPSMFMFGPDLPATREPESIGRRSRLAFNASPYRGRIGPISLHVAREYPNVRYFAQEVEALNLLLHGEYPGKVRRKSPVHLDHPLVAKGKIQMCLDPATWMQELSRCTYSFGTRLHGNVTALLSGTPATVLVHDTRTKELVELHHIPNIALTELSSGVTVPDLVERSDWAPMHRAHPENWRRFAAFLDRHGLRHVHEDGQSPEDFDRRLAEVSVDFAPTVRTIARAPLADLYELKRQAEEPLLRTAFDAARRRRSARRAERRGTTEQ